MEEFFYMYYAPCFKTNKKPYQSSEKLIPARFEFCWVFWKCPDRYLKWDDLEHWYVIVQLYKAHYALYNQRGYTLVLCVTNRRYLIANMIKVRLHWLQHFCSALWLTQNLTYHNSPMFLHLERPEGWEFVSTGTVGFGSGSGREPRSRSELERYRLLTLTLHELQQTELPD